MIVVALKIIAVAIVSLLVFTTIAAFIAKYMDWLVKRLF